MAIQLTEEQQRAIDTAGITPPQIVDPRTSAAYVLIPAEDYETVREALGEERRQKAIRKVALRNAAGRITQRLRPVQVANHCPRAWKATKPAASGFWGVNTS